MKTVTTVVILAIMALVLAAIGGCKSKDSSEQDKAGGSAASGTPDHYGVFANNNGTTKEFTADVPVYDSHVSFVIYDKAVASGLMHTSIEKVNLQPDLPTNPNTPHLDEVAFHTKPVAGNSEMIRIEPTQPLTPGLYKLGNSGAFWVDRTQAVKNLTEGAMLSRAEHQWDKAAVWGGILLKVDPQNERVKDMIANLPFDQPAENALAALASHNWDQAIKLSDMAMKVRPNDPGMLQLVAKVKEGMAEELCVMGKRLAQKGEPGHAMEAYLKGLEQFPNQQRIRDSIAELQKASPSDPAVFQHLGNTIKADGGVRRIAISPDNRTLVCGAGLQGGGGVFIYDLKDQQPIGWHEGGPGNDDGGTATCVSADGKVALAAGVVMDVTQWTPFFGYTLTRCDRRSDEVRRAGLDQDAFQVTKVIPDSAVALADIRVNDLILEEPSSFQGLKPGDIIKVTVIRDGKKEIHPVKLLGTPKTIGTIPYANKHAILHPSGELMMDGSASMSEWRLDFHSLSQGALVGRVGLKQFTKSDCAPGHNMFTPDGSVVVLGNHWIVGLDIANGQLVWELPGHLNGRPVNAMALSADGSLLATDAQEEAIIWDVKKQKEVITIKHPNHYESCIAFSPDSTRLITGANDGMCVWESATGRLLRSFPKVVTDEIKWTTDGRCMITCNGGYVNIWGVDGANLKLEPRVVKCKSATDLHAVKSPAKSNSGLLGGLGD